MIEIDMKLPSCCDECFALDDHGDYPYCLISQDQQGYTFNTRENRMPSCPMKDAEPRVLTLEEVKKLRSLYDGAVWLETCAGILFPVLPEMSLQDSTFYVAIPLVGYRSWGDNKYYGKTWRYWSSRPTDEQREAVKWDD